MSQSPLDVLAERIGRLETANHRIVRENRRLKRAGVVTLLGLVALTIAGANRADGPKVVAAERFLIQGGDGQTRAEFGLNPDGSVVLDLRGRDKKDGTGGFLLGVASDGSGEFRFYDEEETTQIKLGVHPDGSTRLGMFGPDGKAEIGLGFGQDNEAGLSLLGKGGKGQIDLSFAPDGAAGLVILGTDDKARIGLNVNADKSADLRISDPEGKGLVGLIATKDGDLGLAVHDKEGSDRINLEIHPDGQMGLSFRDPGAKDLRERVGLGIVADGRGFLNIRGAGEGSRINMMVPRSGPAGMAISGQDGKKRVVIQNGPDDVPSLNLLDGAGKALFHAPQP